MRSWPRQRLPRVSAVVCSLFLYAALPVRAVDFAPFAGLRFGGSLDTASVNPPGPPVSASIQGALSYGGLVDVPLSPTRSIELYYSRQPTTLGSGGTLAERAHDVTVSLLQAGLVDSIPSDDPRLTWLLIGTLGATLLDLGGAADTEPSVGIGGGVLWMANEHLGLRGDLRALLTFSGGGGGSIRCSGGCNAAFRTSGFAQGEASLGLVVRF